MGDSQTSEVFGVVTTGVVSISPSGFDTELLLVEVAATAAAAAVAEELEVEILLLTLKCGVRAEAESGNSLGVDNISSEEVEDRLLSESPFLMEVMPMEPPPRSRPVILLVANMSQS